MLNKEFSMLLIRDATVSDVPLLKEFVQELAVYERQPEAVIITEEKLTSDGFGAQPKFRALIAEREGHAAGFALFYGFYSSWKGPGILLEDLFVREQFRGQGIGKSLLSRVASIARQESCFAVRWEVLDWNESAIWFYKSLGARFVDELRQVVLEREALNRLADS